MMREGGLSGVYRRRTSGCTIGYIEAWYNSHRRHSTIGMLSSAPCSSNGHTRSPLRESAPQQFGKPGQAQVGVRSVAVARDELGFTGNTVAADVHGGRSGAVLGTADCAL